MCTDASWRGTLVPQFLATLDLPTYPWQRERYWLESATLAPPKVESPALAEHEGLSRPWAPNASPQERLDALQHWVIDQVALLVGVERSAIDASTALTSVGVDSMMALDLRQRVRDRLGLEVRASLLFTDMTVSSLAEQLATLAAADSGPPSDQSDGAAESREEDTSSQRPSHCPSAHRPGEALVSGAALARIGSV